MYKEGLVSNNLQWWIHYKTKPNNIYSIYMWKEHLALNNLEWFIIIIIIKSCHQHGYP